jgi:hypothetical protein
MATREERDSAVVDVPTDEGYTLKIGSRLARRKLASEKFDILTDVWA